MKTVKVNQFDTLQIYDNLHSFTTFPNLKQHIRPREVAWANVFAWYQLCGNNSWPGRRMR